MVRGIAMTTDIRRQPGAGDRFRTHAATRAKLTGRS
jgi:hypothetical protein